MERNRQTTINDAQQAAGSACLATKAGGAANEERPIEALGTAGSTQFEPQEVFLTNEQNGSQQNKTVV